MLVVILKNTIQTSLTTADRTHPVTPNRKDHNHWNHYSPAVSAKNNMKRPGSHFARSAVEDTENAYWSTKTKPDHWQCTCFTFLSDHITQKKKQQWLKFAHFFLETERTEKWHHHLTPLNSVWSWSKTPKRDVQAYPAFDSWTRCMSPMLETVCSKDCWKNMVE